MGDRDELVERVATALAKHDWRDGGGLPVCHDQHRFHALCEVCAGDVNAMAAVAVAALAGSGDEDTPPGCRVSEGFITAGTVPEFVAVDVASPEPPSPFHRAAYQAVGDDLVEIMPDAFPTGGAVASPAPPTAEDWQNTGATWNAYFGRWEWLDAHRSSIVVAGGRPLGSAYAPWFVNFMGSPWTDHDSEADALAFVVGLQAWAAAVTEAKGER